MTAQLIVMGVCFTVVTLSTIGSAAMRFKVKRSTVSRDAKADSAAGKHNVPAYLYSKLLASRQ